MTAYYRAPARRVPYRVPRRYRRSTVDPRAIAGAGAAIVAVVAAAGGITGHHGHHHGAGRGHAVAVAGSWPRAFLATAGLPVTACDLAAIRAWRRAEGSNPGWLNPLDTTMPEPGSRPVNSVGVQAYTSRRQGLAATSATLHNGLYGPVLAALRAGDDAQRVADAVAASPWGTLPFGASC